MIETYILGGLGGVITIMLGAIWHEVGQLKNRFDAFVGDCRDRHENVVLKCDYIREMSGLERKIDTAHSRLDTVGVKHGYEIEREI